MLLKTPLKCWGVFLFVSVAVAVWISPSKGRLQVYFSNYKVGKGFLNAESGNLRSPPTFWTIMDLSVPFSLNLKLNVFLGRKYMEKKKASLQLKINVAVQFRTLNPFMSG